MTYLLFGKLELHLPILNGEVNNMDAASIRYIFFA